MNLKTLISTTVLTLAMSFPLYSEMFLVDFGIAQTPASPDTNGNYWSQPSTSTIAGFQLRETDSPLSDSGVFLTASGFGAFSSGGTSAPESSLGNLAISQATVDFAYVNIGQTATITLSGLDNSQLYSFDFFGSRDHTENRSTTYEIGANSVVLQTSGTDLGGPGINMNDSTFVTLSNIAPTANSISISVSGVSSFGYINAMQITSVIPEASSVMLMGFGTLALMMTLRRRRK